MLLRVAASIEQHSEHPLASAILSAAQEHHIVINSTVIGFVNHVGRGVEGLVDVGLVRVGNRSFMAENGIQVTTEMEARMYNSELQGRTVVCVALNKSLCGLIGIMDTIKPEALGTVMQLRRMDIDVWMVTGDNMTTAVAIADKLDIPKVPAACQR